MQPILHIRNHKYAITHVSMVEMNGLGFGSSGVGEGSPATTGSMKNGPNLIVSVIPNLGSPLLVQGAGDEMGESFWGDLSLLLHAIHVHSEAQLFTSGRQSKGTWVRLTMCRHQSPDRAGHSRVCH